MFGKLTVIVKQLIPSIMKYPLAWDSDFKSILYRALSLTRTGTDLIKN
jgi:hypothetical protein